MKCLWLQTWYSPSRQIYIGVRHNPPAVVSGVPLTATNDQSATFVADRIFDRPSPFVSLHRRRRFRHLCTTSSYCTVQCIYYRQRLHFGFRFDGRSLCLIGRSVAPSFHSPSLPCTPSRLEISIRQRHRRSFSRRIDFRFGLVNIILSSWRDPGHSRHWATEA